MGGEACIQGRCRMIPRSESGAVVQNSSFVATHSPLNFRSASCPFLLALACCWRPERATPFLELFVGGEQRMLAVVNMLTAAEKKHPELEKTLEGFAELVWEKLAQTACFWPTMLMATCRIHRERKPRRITASQSMMLVRFVLVVLFNTSSLSSATNHSPTMQLLSIKIKDGVRGQHTCSHSLVHLKVARLATSFAILFASQIIDNMLSGRDVMELRPLASTYAVCNGSTSSCVLFPHREAVHTAIVRGGSRGAARCLGRGRMCCRGNCGFDLRFTWSMAAPQLGISCLRFLCRSRASKEAVGSSNLVLLNMDLSQGQHVEEMVDWVAGTKKQSSGEKQPTMCLVVRGFSAAVHSNPTRE